ncbi:MAG: VOC family protein [Gammaproteobacteria bacterium]
MKKLLLTFLAAGTLAWCAHADELVPPITATPTQTWDPGQLVWADLLTDDVDAAKAFYSKVFAWDFVGDNQYAQASHGGVPVAGIAFHAPHDPNVSEVAWLISISVDDVDAAVNAASGAGGTVLEAPRSVPERGRFAIIEDNQDAVLVLLKSAQGDPPDRRSVDNEWIWAELWTPDTAVAADFYAAAVGYEAKTITENDGGRYTLLTHGGAPKTGIVPLPWENVEPNWLPYLRVADVGDTIERVENAGGQVLLPPRKENDDGRVAIVSDPTGGVFAIQARRAAQ